MREHLRVLVIDDSLTICRYLERLLTRMGHDVSIASDGTTGMRLHETESFDLILLDLMLPDTDGIALLKDIRSRDQDTCIVMITGHGDIKTAIEAVQQGADGYVEKSQISIGKGLDEFWHIVHRALEFRESQVRRIQLEQEIRQKNRELEATVRELQQARNELQEERNKLREILFSISEIVIAVDQEGRILLMNPQAEKELGISLEEVIGQPISQLPIHKQLLTSLQQALSSKEPVRIEIPNPFTGSNQDGRVFSVTLNPVRLHSDGLPGAIISLHDISQEKELERMKADFYSMITHDLRSPAMAITGFVDLLIQETAGPLNEAQKEMMDIIRRSIRKLLDLINDFLDYSAIDAGFLRLQPAETDVSQVIREAVREIQPLAHQRQHTLEVQVPDEPAIAWVDGERVGQVVTNLLSNAIKYTPQGGRITVRLRTQPDSLVIEVSDNGIGIPAGQIPLLFSKYTRVANEHTRCIQGTGLGLLIVKEIVKAHGGDVEVESEVGRGSTFRVTLPRKQPALAPYQPQEVAIQDVIPAAAPSM